MPIERDSYLSELIPYGGIMVPRGYAYQKLLTIAQAQGHSAKESRILADRWMQGYELRIALERKP